ncbi:MAG: CopG family transcriptional regulator [Prevotella sp.]|nr:CopG family transcriptional regulator [Prevotella sp.]
MKEQIIVNVSWCGKNFSASLGDNVPGAVVFTAGSFRELRKEAQEALDFHFEGMREDGEDVPSWWLSGEYEFVYQYTDVASLLQAYSDLVPLVSISRASGINQRLLSHYANGIKRPRPQQRQRIVDGIHKIGRELLTVV